MVYSVACLLQYVKGWADQRTSSKISLQQTASNLCLVNWLIFSEEKSTLVKRSWIDRNGLKLMELRIDGKVKASHGKLMIQNRVGIR